MDRSEICEDARQLQTMLLMPDANANKDAVRIKVLFACHDICANSSPTLSPTSGPVRCHTETVAVRARRLGDCAPRFQAWIRAGIRGGVNSRWAKVIRDVHDGRSFAASIPVADKVIYSCSPTTASVVIVTHIAPKDRAGRHRCGGRWE
jgi:hypothetical protein